MVQLLSFMWVLSEPLSYAAMEVVAMACYMGTLLVIILHCKLCGYLVSHYPTQQWRWLQWLVIWALSEPLSWGGLLCGYLVSHYPTQQWGWLQWLVIWALSEPLSWGGLLCGYLVSHFPTQQWGWLQWLVHLHPLPVGPHQT